MKRQQQQNQSQRQSQKMTPKTMQAMHMLSLAGTEWLDFLSEQAQNNPALEYTPPTNFVRYSKAASTETPRDWEDNRQHFGHLEWHNQWQASSPAADELPIGKALIDLINPNGILDGFEENWQAHCPKETTYTQAAGILLRLQKTLEPTGVGARNAIECIDLQLSAEGFKAEHPQRLVLNHLSDIAKKRHADVAEQLAISIDTLTELLEHIRHIPTQPIEVLQPRHEPQTIMPVLETYQDTDGEWRISYLKSNLPVITLQKGFEDIAKHAKQAPRDKSQMMRQLADAKYILAAVEMRQKTLMRIATLCIHYQQQFLLKGEQYLRPMTMTQAAKQLGMHVATISRAVANKHIQTPRGVLPLRHFLPHGIATQYGYQAAAPAIQSHIKECIDQENKQKPLSDQKIVNILSDKLGVRIARRTVTKYREMMHIGSTRQRRETP